MNSRSKGACLATDWGLAVDWFWCLKQYVLKMNLLNEVMSSINILFCVCPLDTKFTLSLLSDTANTIFLPYIDVIQNLQSVNTVALTFLVFTISFFNWSVSSKVIMKKLTFSLGH